MIATLERENEVPKRYLTEWEHEFWLRSERLAADIGTVIDERLGTDSEASVDTLLGDDPVGCGRPEGVRSSLILPLHVVVTPRDDPGNTFSLVPPPVRLSSTLASWEDAVYRLPEQLSEFEVHKFTVTKVKGTLRDHPPEVRTAVARDMIADRRFEISGNMCKHMRLGVFQMIGTLDVTGEVESVDGTTAPIKTVTMCFDTEFKSVCEQLTDESAPPVATAEPGSSESG